MNDLDNIVANLERQREAIDKALEALRGVSGASTDVGRPAARKAANKRTGLTEEGRRRLSENMRKRWAAKRTAGQSRRARKRRSA